jgi:hypothetical protein
VGRTVAASKVHLDAEPSSPLLNLELHLTPFETVKAKLGKTAAQVWSHLQVEEVRANAGPRGTLLKDVAGIAQATGFSTQIVQEAVIGLALAGLITKITTDGRVAA